MSFKKTLLALVLLFLSGCGWHSVYYQSSDEETLQTEKVDILPISNESGRTLRLKLEDLLNPQKKEDKKEYTLQVTLKERIDSDQGILGDNTSTRATMRLDAKIVLKQKDKVLLDTETFAVSSYNILMLPYPTVTAEETTRHRLLDVLANQIAMRVSVYFKNSQEKK
ncbi:MAG: hypothetical protein J6P93_03290 [Alphaproteobacteria bacterium]|nr:hypothetical protein [Alphaproteobacteria bacterium]